MKQRLWIITMFASVLGPAAAFADCIDGVRKETPEGAFSITVDAKYTYRPSKEEADRLNAESRKIQSEIDALEKLPPELTKERNDFMAKYSEKRSCLWWTRRKWSGCSDKIS